MTEEQVFLAALDLPNATARAAYLDKACGADAARRRQVEALLAAHFRSGEFLDVPVAEQVQVDSSYRVTVTVGGEAGASETDSDDESEGLQFLTPSSRPDALGRLGHYEVLQVLGKGGFGVVFRAFDDNLQRVVAVKVLASHLAATSPARKRFLREARSSAKVKHENVVQVYAVEEQPLPYLVMEFVPGETLQQRLDRSGPLEAAEVLQLGRQLAEGLAAAHGMGLVHRDIKPANILLEAGPNPCVRITDFGLARAADDASLTQSGMVAGTPMYMAPEQAQGDALDHRADLFSLGSVLYTMCSGRPPFRANSTLAVLKRVAEDTPRPIREIIPEVPQWLCDIITCLHAKKPEDRFATAREVADLLGRGLTALQRPGSVPFPVLLPPVEEKPAPQETPEAAPVARPRSRKSRSAAVAGVLLLVVAGLGVAEATGATNVRGSIKRFFAPADSTVVNREPVNGPEVVKIPPVAPPAPQPPTGTPIVPKAVQNEPPATWTVLKPIEMTSEGGATLTLQKDGSILASGTHPDRDVYTLTFRGFPAKIEALRLEVLPHDSLGPNKGPGRNDSGEFILTKINAQMDSATKQGAPRPLKLADAWADNVRGDDSHVGLAIDEEDNSGWVTEIGKPHFAVFGLAEPVATPDGTVLRVTLEFKHELPRKQLGCFRVSVASDVKAAKASIDAVGESPDRRAAEYVLSIGGEVQVNDQGEFIKAVANLPAALRLNTVHLLYNAQVTDAGLAHFKDCKNLTQVRLTRSTQVTDDGLAHFKDCKDLTSLYLHGTRVSDAGLAHFKDCKNLAYLGLSNTKVGDAGVVHFKDCKNLTYLGLESTQVSDRGAAYFKDCKNLMHINLSGTQVSDAGLAHFKDCKNLERLDLAGTQVSDASLAHFKDCKNLTGLDLRKTKVTETGIDELKKALPKCKIDTAAP